MQETAIISEILITRLFDSSQIMDLSSTHKI
jgi:hypothetical protein